MSIDEQVARHYGRAGIAERVLAALRGAHGADVAITPETLAPLDQFHGRGIEATRDLAALLAPQPGERVLDIGCGIGGPARWIATNFGCHVTGVDLTAEFCTGAEALNEATGLSDRVAIRHGSALDLPLPDQGFDAAYSQNVVMNIADKRRFYDEAFRVLRPGGRLALANLCAGPGGALHFPVPWAMTSETSFLATPDETRADLVAAGFEIVEFHDTTARLLPGQRRDRERVERDGLPPLGVHVVLGDNMRERRINSARNAEEGRVLTIEVLLRRP